MRTVAGSRALGLCQSFAESLEREMDRTVSRALGIVDCSHTIFLAIMGIVALCGCRHFVKGLRKGKCDWRSCCFLGEIMQNLFGEVPTFTLGILVHNLQGFPLKESMAVKFTAGNVKAQTTPRKSVSPMTFNEEVTLKVYQGTKVVSISIVDSNGKSHARGEIDVENDLCALWDDVPDVEQGGSIKEQAIRLKSSRIKTPCKVILSFSKGGLIQESAQLLEQSGLGLETDNMSGALGMLLLESTKSEQNKHRHDSEEEKPLDKLEVLAGTVQGPIMKTGNWGRSHNMYMAFYKANAEGQIWSGKEKMKWYLGLWEKESDMQKKAPDKAHMVPALRITTVDPDGAKDEYFAVRWANDVGDRNTLHLKRVDRERDTWVEAIKLFIEELRKKEKQKEDRRKPHRHQRRGSAQTKQDSGSGNTASDGDDSSNVARSKDGHSDGDRARRHKEQRSGRQDST